MDNSVRNINIRKFPTNKNSRNVEIFFHHGRRSCYFDGLLLDIARQSFVCLVLKIAYSIYMGKPTKCVETLSKSMSIIFAPNIHTKMDSAHHCAVCSRRARRIFCFTQRSADHKTRKMDKCWYTRITD